MPKNDTLARRISESPNWFHYKLIVAFSYERQQHKAETVIDILKKHFDAIPNLEQKRLLDVYDNLTPQQRRNTKKRDF